MFWPQIDLFIYGVLPAQNVTKVPGGQMLYIKQK